MRLRLTPLGVLPAAGWLLGTTLLLASCSSERDPTTAGDSTQADGQASPPAAQGEPTPDETAATTPGGVLPLVPGVYVLAGTDCTVPANAGVRFYDGRGISGTATHACRTQIRSQRDATYRVEQSCIDTPSGDGPRTREPQTITVHGARAFTLATADESARFQYCPMDEVPGYLLERLTRDGHVDGGSFGE